MRETTTSLLRQALRLSTSERAALAEELLASLAQPDAELDKLWLAEAEDRLAAYRAGELAAVDAEEVFAELGRAI
jgi:putative addiction module component (TIGR02574 family)